MLPHPHTFSLGHAAEQRRFIWCAALCQHQMRTSERFLEGVESAVKIHIDRRYPLAEVAEAHRDLEARRLTGSAVLLP